MIEERYVSFETAKLLKEAGFDVPTRGTWRTKCTGDAVFVEHFYGQTTDDISRRSADGFQHEYLAPTQSLAARWLREVHKLNIYACFDYIEFDKGNSSYFFARENVDINDYTSVYFSLQSYDSYEEAIEGGLIETLKTILNCK